MREATDRDKTGIAAGPGAPPPGADDVYGVVRRHRRLLWRLLLVVLPLAVTLAVSAAYITYFAADLWLTRQVQQVTNPVFRQLMIAVSWIGNGYKALAIVLTTAALLTLLRLRLEMACLLMSAGLGQLLAVALKAVTGRPRPALELVEVYWPRGTLSFPSGHVVHFVATYGFLFYLVFILLPRSPLRSALLALLGVLVGLVGLSRVYLGEHWASDVAGGYLFGLVWLVLMIDFYWRLKVRRLRGQ